MLLPSAALCLMRAALILGLLSYCAATAKCLWEQAQKTKQRKKQQAEMDRINAFVLPEADQIDMEAYSGSQYEEKQKHCCKHLMDGDLRPAHCVHHTGDWQKPLQMHVYHFVPVYRWVVVLKSLLKQEVHDDAEALHKVHSLCTFTLGFVQVVCILISLSEMVLRLDDTALIIVLANLILSFFITIINSFTPICGQMKDAARIEELKLLHCERSREDLILLCSGSDASRTANLEKVHTEIKELAQVIYDFSPEVGNDGCSMMLSQEVNIVGCPTMFGVEALSVETKLSEVSLDIFSAQEVCLLRTCLYIKHFKWCCGSCANV